ncbi:MAG: glutamate synthase (NADPH), homotetrameric [candidate division Zixibacteria bacterium RBG_16_50_21]|nr:MAG: glutamate synthase (NADPH), homotetrameric [candidate division Zixibacteria bacterium RBG_16_50_21]
MQVPRAKMPERDPQERGNDFNEVPLGFTPLQAMLEASRCLVCQKEICRTGCPVNVPIKDFMILIANGDFPGALRKIREANSLPAICGRVCPQEDQCEKLCSLAKKYESVSIGYLERFVADMEMESGNIELPDRASATGLKVAIVGSGPSGLTCAGDLARLGHTVTIFEAFHVAGGVLMYGIPEFRLPKKTVQREIDYLKKLGVKFEFDTLVGRTVTIPELFQEGYQAVFIGTGAGLPVFMNIPGENLNGVYSANEFLTRVNLMKAYDFPHYDTPVMRGKKVAVIGGGNTAMDAVRCALRLGAEKAMIVYRRSAQEMPARKDEIHHAQAEGIIFHFLTAPVKITGNGDGWVTGMECLKMQLGEPDASGRRRPVPIPESDFALEVDTVVVAVGTSANPIVPGTTPGLATNKWGYILADPETGATNLPGVYAGGDIVTGAATVISAAGAGKRSAEAIHKYLMGTKENNFESNGSKD